MCGRYVAASPPDEVAAYFGADAPTAELAANYNVAPTHDVLGVVEGRPDTEAAGRRLLEAFHWGLVPRWAKDVKIGNRMINARADGVATKNAFRSAFTRRRCIVPADGFFEWRKAVDDPKRKQPYFIHRADGEQLALAGLWERWLDPANDDTDGLQRLLVPAPDELLVAHAVDTAVGNVRNRGAELIDPIVPDDPGFAATLG